MFVCKQNLFPYAYRKLLKEDQLEAGTKAAQQEEMERLKRLEQQRKDFPTPAPAVPDSLGDCLYQRNYAFPDRFKFDMFSCTSHSKSPNTFPSLQ